MFSKMRSVVPLVRKCALLFLIFSVFSLGLQAKLALYKSSPPLNVAAAKVSTEKRSAQVLSALEKRDETHHPTDKLAFSFLQSIIVSRPSPNSGAEQAEIALLYPTRLDNSGIYSLHRPPPTLT
jgi:hypothetical protein